MQRSVVGLWSRVRVATRVATLLSVALIAVAAGAPVPAAVAGQTTVKPTAIPCGGGHAVQLGSFSVSCAGSAASLVTVTAAGTRCGALAKPSGSCTVQFDIAVKKQGIPSRIIGGGVTQSSPVGAASSTGASSSTGAAVPLAYRTIVWHYALQAPGQAATQVDITVVAGQGVGMTAASMSIQDTKNVADGAAKSQAVE